MKELTVEITNESGLHARPATAFTQLAAKFASKVTIAANGKTADAKSTVESFYIWNIDNCYIGLNKKEEAI